MCQHLFDEAPIAQQHSSSASGSSNSNPQQPHSSALSAYLGAGTFTEPPCSLSRLGISRLRLRRSCIDAKFYSIYDSPLLAIFQSLDELCAWSVHDSSFALSSFFPPISQGTASCSLRKEVASCQVRWWRTVQWLKKMERHEIISIFLDAHRRWC